MELGIDSLGAVELKNLLESKFAITLPATLSFDYPTALAMADFIASQLENSRMSSEGPKSFESNEQNITMVQTVLMDIVKSILGINISIDQVINISIATSRCTKQAQSNYQSLAILLFVCSL